MTWTTMTIPATTEGGRTVTARVRILGWILLVAVIAITLVVVTSGAALFSRTHARANAELVHEVEKFREFASRPDPATGTVFTSVVDLLTGHLGSNIPERDEMFFSIVDGRPSKRSVREPPLRLDRDQAFVAGATAVAEPKAGSMETEAGPVAYAVVPVSVVGDPVTGHLVVLEFLADEMAEAWSVIWIMSLFSLSALAMVGITGWFVAGRVLDPIRELRETAAGITDADLTRRIAVVGHDDVGQLAATFNGMLDRLEAAFEGQRRFLDDAGHELRTPITIIRGQLELMGDEPEDRDQTLALVDDELRRMSRLVDDLIMLARSEQPDFLTVRPTDLADLVLETFTKATALADRRWVIDETPEGAWTLDGQRVTQAMLQLVANAVGHTGPKDTVAVGGAVLAERLRLWVRDTGTGIGLADQERIFERFARGSNPVRNPRSSGLGLAIVSRIAAAHGGSVELESQPGHGSVFTLDLPRRYAEEGT